MKSIKFAHLSDIHLGKSFSFLREFPEKQKKARKELRSTLNKAFQLITAEEIDFVLICGDIFDKSKPLTKETNYFVNEVERFLNENPKTQILIIPGGHDHLSSSSPYMLPSFQHLLKNKNLRLFSNDGPSFFRLKNSSGVKVCFHGRPHTEKSSGISPLKDLFSDEKSDFNIALAHGSLPTIKTPDSRDPIKDEQIKRFDYVALGDWHSYRTYPDDKNPEAVYSGSLETISFKNSQNKRGLVITEIKKEFSKNKEIHKKVSITLKRVSNFNFSSFKIKNQKDLEKAINSLESTGKENIVKVTISSDSILNQEFVYKTILNSNRVFSCEVQKVEEDLQKPEENFDKNDFRTHVRKVASRIAEKKKNQIFKEAGELLVKELSGYEYKIY